jgi:hypothetical protein
VGVDVRRTKKPGLRNPVAKILREDPQFRLKIVNPKKSVDKAPTFRGILDKLEQEKEYTDDEEFD